MRRTIISLVSLFFVTPVWSRYEAALIKEYGGRHPDTFAAQYDRVRLLTRQAQLEVSSQLGLLQYQQGFSSPLIVRFTDGAPPEAENALAYVRMLRGPQGFMQELVINLDATQSYDKTFDKIFFHEMVHAVLNDATGGEAAIAIPRWTQEGLAQYIAGEGKTVVATAAGQFKRSQVGELLHPLNGPASAAAYPQYYLAIEAMHEKHSINAVQAFVRDLVRGKPVIEAIGESTGLTWEQFEAQVREYSLKVFQDKARPDLE